MSSEAPPAPPTQATPRPARERRWPRRLARAGFALGLVLVGGALILAANLDAPAVRDLVRAQIRARTGIGLDYGPVDLGLHGLHVRGVRVAPPAEDATIIGDVLTIGRLDIAWSLRDALHGDWILTRLDLRDVSLHLVIDADGGNTLARLLAGFPEGEEPSAPLPPPSRLMRLFEGLPSAGLRRGRARNIRLRVSLRGPSGRSRDLRLGGLSLDYAAAVGEAVQVRGHGPVLAAIRARADGRLVVGGDPSFDVPPGTPAAAAISEWLRAGHDLPARAEAALKLSGDRGLSLGATVYGEDRRAAPLALTKIEIHLDPGAGRTSFHAFAGLRDRLGATVEAVLADGSPTTGPIARIDKLELRGDLAPFAPLLPPAFGRLSVRVCRGRATVRGLRNLGPGRIPTLSRVALHAEATGLHYRLGPLEVSLDRALAEIEGEPGPEGTVILDAITPIHGLAVRDVVAGMALRVDDFASTSRITELKVNLADPLASTAELHARAELSRLEAVAGPTAATLVTTVARLEAALGQRRLNLYARAAVDDLAATAAEPAATLSAAGLTAGLTVTELPADIASGLGQSELRLEFAADRLDATGSGQQAHMDRPRADLRAAGIALPPFAGIAAIGTMKLHGTAGRASIGAFGSLSDLAFHLSGRVLKLDPRRPEAATGHLEADVRVGTARFGLRLDRERDPLHWRADGHVPALGKLVSGLALPAALRRTADWDRLAVDATSRGKAEGISGGGRVRVEHHEEVTISGLVARVAGFRAALPLARATLDGRGTGLKQELHLAADLSRPTVAGYHGVGSHALRGRLLLDGTAPELSFELALNAPAGPGLTARGSAGFSPHDRLELRLRAGADHLGSLAAALPSRLLRTICLDLGRLSGSVGLRGEVTASRRSLLDGATWRRWAAGAPPDLRLDLEADGHDLRCRLAGSTPARAALSRVDARAEIRVVNRVLNVSAEATAPGLRFELPGVEGELKKMRGSLRIHSDRLAAASGSTRVQLDARLGAMRQSALPQYRIGNAHLVLDATHLHRADLRIDRLALSNPAAGSSVELSGMVQLPGAERDTAAANGGLLSRVTGRRSLALVGRAVQDLAPLAAADDRISASGRVSLPFRIESGDFAVIRTRARVRLRGVAARIPALHLGASGITGEVPVLQDIAIGEDGLRLLGGGRENAYARWRFADQHPFIGGDHFVSIRSLDFRGHAFGPLAGNAGIDRNVLRLDQVELGLLGGKVTGQCIVDIAGRDTDVLFRGNVTGVRAPGSRARLDANAALEFRPGKLAIIGRAAVLRLGREHLRAMLDLWDPYHEDDRANKLRLALVAGFPKSMQMRFTHGFASFSVALGGLGNLVRIDEIRGIPLGPAMTRYVAPFVDRADALLRGRLP